MLPLSFTQSYFILLDNCPNIKGLAVSSPSGGCCTWREYSCRLFLAYQFAHDQLDVCYGLRKDAHGKYQTNVLSCATRHRDCRRLRHRIFQEQMLCHTKWEVVLVSFRRSMSVAASLSSGQLLCFWDLLFLRSCGQKKPSSSPIETHTDISKSFVEQYRLVDGDNQYKSMRHKN